MRHRRLKIHPDQAEGFYHLMSRTVNGEFLFGEVEKEMLRRHIWLVADYCGLRILEFSVMTNHFHIVVAVPKKEPISDQELLRRYALLHSGHSPWQVMQQAAIERMLAENGDDAQEWRNRQQAMMGDISPYMQLLKQRFSIWFNRTHNRFGTLWAERYKSVLLENGLAVLMISIYVALNAVVAGMVNDPKEYRFSGYTQALAGDRKAQAGICSLFPGKTWPEAQAEYRQKLFRRGANPRGKGTRMAPEQLETVVASGGRLAWAELMRLQMRYLTDGAVLGGKAFVAEQLQQYRALTGRGARTKVRDVPDFDGLAIMRNLRSSPAVTA